LSIEQLLDPADDKSDFDQANVEYANLKSAGKAPQQTEEDYKNALARAETRVVLFQERLNSIQKRYDSDKTKLQNRVKSTESALKQQNNALKEAQDKEDELASQLSNTEDEINGLLIPETEQNNFKLWITAAFSVLVAGVIYGFFRISEKDVVVR